MLLDPRVKPEDDERREEPEDDTFIKEPEDDGEERGAGMTKRGGSPAGRNCVLLDSRSGRE